METRTKEEEGGAAVYSVVTVQGCARDQHALCASGGESLTSPISKNVWVLAAGTIEDREEELFSDFKEQANIELGGMIIRTTAMMMMMSEYLHDITDQTRYTTLGG